MARVTSFWRWFWSGDGSRYPGWLNLFDAWIIIHIVVGISISNLINISGQEAATKSMIPASSAIVALAFTWGNRIGTILQDREFRDFLVKHSDGLENYVYLFQLVFLLVAITAIYISIMSLGGLNIGRGQLGGLSKGVMFFLISFSLRECWNMFTIVNMLTLLNDQYVRSQAQKKSNKIPLEIHD